jgi:hypothetical protein
MRLIKLIAAFFLVCSGSHQARAAVTMTFWSHELGNSFPHAFVTLRGIPDAGGAPVDVNYGFTARTLSPALLFRPVAGKLEVATANYIRSSDAQFSVVMTDTQYAAIIALAAEWGGSNSQYRLGDRNCVHFVQEAARRVGLTGLDQLKLMKRPRSFLKAIAVANAGSITVNDLHGKAYLDGLTPLRGLPDPAPHMPEGATFSRSLSAIQTAGRSDAPTGVSSSNAKRTLAQ